MASDDRILDLIGILIVVGLVFGLGTLIFFSGSGPADPSPSAPDANWTTERLNATHVQLAHTGGETIPSDDLAVTVDGEERPVPWSGDVGRGDVGVVRVAQGEEVTLSWTGGGDRVTLGEWTP